MTVTSDAVSVAMLRTTIVSHDKKKLYHLPYNIGSIRADNSRCFLSCRAVYYRDTA